MPHALYVCVADIQIRPNERGNSINKRAYRIRSFQRRCGQDALFSRRILDLYLNEKEASRLNR